MDETTSTVVTTIDTAAMAIETPRVETDLVLIATKPEQLQAEQRRLIAWCENRIASLREERTDAQNTLDVCIARHWNRSASQKLIRKIDAEITYMEKIQQALELGYYIVPDFPCDVFAIRTDREASGSAKSSWGSYRNAIDNLPQQQAPGIAAGEGEYRNPTPLGQHTESIESADKKTTTHYAEVVDFAKLNIPLKLAKIPLLDAVHRAMAEKIFDELAILPSRRERKRDPMIVGRVIRPNGLRINFLVAWWLETKSLETERR